MSKQQNQFKDGMSRELNFMTAPPRTTFDWDAHTPLCPNCGTKSGTVAGGICQHCDPARLAAEAAAKAEKKRARKPRHRVPVDYPERACKNCGNLYKPRQKNSVNCSTACAYATNHKKRDPLDPRACAQCATEFQPKTSNHRYCSYGCKEAGKAANAIKAPRTKSPVDCMICGTAFVPYRANQLMCSQRCRDKKLKRADHTPRPCEVCNVEYIPYQGRQRVCGEVCKRTLKARLKREATAAAA